jgi:chromosome segregation ATPase
MQMLLTVEKVWSKVQDFIKRVDAIGEEAHETKKELKLLEREVEIQGKDTEHLEKIVSHLSHKAAEMELRIKKLESEKHGARVSAGRAKAENARLKEQVKVVSSAKPGGKKGQNNEGERRKDH